MCQGSGLRRGAGKPRKHWFPGRSDQPDLTVISIFGEEMATPWSGQTGRRSAPHLWPKSAASQCVCHRWPIASTAIQPRPGRSRVDLPARRDARLPDNAQRSPASAAPAQRVPSEPRPQASRTGSLQPHGGICLRDSSLFQRDERALPNIDLESQSVTMCPVGMRRILVHVQPHRLARLAGNSLQCTEDNNVPRKNPDTACPQIPARRRIPGPPSETANRCWKCALLRRDAESIQFSSSRP